MADDSDTSRRKQQLSRRRLLASLGASGLVALAGCLGDGESSDEPASTDTPRTSTDTPAPETPTPTATATATESPTPEPTQSASRPVTGDLDDGLAAFDETMLAYMDDLDLDAGALGVAKEGEIVVERGYGWADPEQTEPLASDALFRIASISKGLTDAAVTKLTDEGELSGDDAVYPLLDVEPPGGEPADERWQDVTVRHLSNHTGGWNIRRLGFDPMYAPLRVADGLGLDEPPTKYDTTRFMLDQPMQFDPGSREAYSNFGYSLLGQVIEAVSGMSFEEYVRSELLGPAGVEDVELGYTRPADRPAREVWYDDDTTCSNAFSLEVSDTGPCADVGFLVSEFDSAGGYIASTRGLLGYLRSYWLGGAERDDRELEYALFGSHPGSFALARQYPGEVDVVALFNGRSRPLRRSRTIERRLRETVSSLGL